MEKDKRNRETENTLKPKIGEPGYLNKNCWLIRNFKANPYKRCQYCESRFKDCLFLQYQTISAFLIVFFIILSFFIKGKISEVELTLLTTFSFVIIYGYFFNKSTDKLIQACFAQRKTSEALEELTEKLEDKVEEQTKEIREAFKKVSKLSQRKSELLSVVAHQIKNPLVALRGYSSLVKEGTIKGTKQINETINKIHSVADKLIDLLNNLLDLSHIEDGRMHYEFEKLELNKMLKEIIDDFQFVAQRKGLSLEFQPITEEVFVNADKYKLSQVFRNLIDNAIKYTEKGFVRVNVKCHFCEANPQKVMPNIKNQNKVLVIVSDSGIGLSKEVQEKLFQPFSRGVEEKQILGAGLGLYIAKQILADHNGKIWAESKGEGRGSNFYVELPVMIKSS